MSKAALIILDGWGHGKKDHSDGIFTAHTPFIDGLYKNYPSAQLITYGKEVGLPDGQMGNSEVGHLNIGAGRIVYQDYLRINNAIDDMSFYQNETLVEALELAKRENKNVHLMGLVSRGGVHSSLDHLTSICELTRQMQLEHVFIHAFTDGRDCDPRSGLGFIAELEEAIEDSPVQIASIIGRYFAMDRDNRWERIAKAYDLLISGKGEPANSAQEAIRASYQEEVTDEFIQPISLQKQGQPVATIQEGDVVICFNFRTDRCREITQALTQKDFPEFGMKRLNLHYCTMTNYDKSFQGVHVLFDKENLKNTLGEVVSAGGKTQIRIAETEKYPHVTFFFSGGREIPFEGESRILVNSPKVPTYDLQPEMNAMEVTEKICTELQTGKTDFICLNFANPDMVGHTGVPEAIVKACETIDECTRKVVETGLKHGYSFVIIADHGNADKMMNEDGSPHTAHTTNMVPVIVINPDTKKLNNGILADVAPTLLQILGLDQPHEMTGQSLIA